MKQRKEIFLTSVALFAICSITSVSANTNGYVFPPANAMGEINGTTTNTTNNGYVYPPQTPTQSNRMNRMPQAPRFNNSQRAYPQQPGFVPNRNNRAPSYNQYPRRTMPQAVPRSMPRAMPQYAPRQAYRGQKQYPSYPYYRKNNNIFPFSNNMMPFGNSGKNNFFPFSSNNMPFNNNSFGMPGNPMNNMFSNNKNGNLPFFNQRKKKRKKAWGTERNIWPDFYTDFTDEAWDTVTGGPRDLGKMPGGWRFPYISTPDPVTVSDAIVNQFPPIAEEAGNMADFSDWGVFDKK